MMENVDSMLGGFKAKPEPVDLGAAEPKAAEERATETTENSNEKNVDESYNNSNQGESQEESQDDSKKVDEYGNEYTERKEISIEEHKKILEDYKRASNERMNQEIRRRLEKNKNSQQYDNAPQDDYQQTTDSQSSGSENIDLDAELDKFLDEAFERRLTTREKEKQQELQRQKATEEMSKFQKKFDSGVERYDDFVETLDGASVKPSMLVASKNMKDPAAFWYHAAKNRSEDLSRIASLENPVDQAVELGRLEADMRKGRSVTQAGKPPTQVSGDTGSYKPEKSIDSMIMDHAKDRFKSRS